MSRKPNKIADGSVCADCQHCGMSITSSWCELMMDNFGLFEGCYNWHPYNPKKDSVEIGHVEYTPEQMGYEK